MKWTSKSNTSITIEGDTDEIQAVDRMLNGACFVGQSDDRRAISIDRYRATTIVPADDPALGSRFEPRGIDEQYFTPADESVFIPEVVSTWSLALYVEGIGGYGGRIQYDHNARLLKRAGFKCLRSERDADGLYWEKWYLPGTFFVPLGAIRNDEKKPELDEVIKWLCRLHVGSISIVSQKYGLSID